MEMYDLYTADRERTGKTMERWEQAPEGYYRLVVHICIFSSDGRMLIQQRQPFKRGWANMWDISAGGSAIAGETSRQAAERELREELGIKLELPRPSLTIHWEKGFDEYFIETLDVDPASLQLQPEEVQAARWATKEEILALISEGRFVPYDRSMIELLFYRRNTRSSVTLPDASMRKKP